MIAVDTFPQLPEDGKKRKKERKRTVVRRAGRKETSLVLMVISVTSTLVAKRERKNVVCKEIRLKVKCTNIIF